MDYKEALKKYQTAKQKLLTAEKDLAAQRAGLRDHRKLVPEAHETLTDRMAEAEVDEATQDEVEAARRDYEQKVDELEERKTQVAAKEKAVPLFRKKVNEAKKQYQEAAYPKYMNQAENIIQQFVKAFAQLEKAKKKQDELWEEIKQTGLDPTHYMPTQVEEIGIKLNHLRKTFSPDAWMQHAAEKNDNFTISNNN